LSGFFIFGEPQRDEDRKRHEECNHSTFVVLCVLAPWWFKDFIMLQRKTLTKEQALQKLRHYCAYQERCHSEVRSKLYQLGVTRKIHDELISDLIQQDYLNEERFAVAYARGKFRINRWGKRKIESGLREKQISDYCIKKALKEIPEKDYKEKLEKLVEVKFQSLEGESDFNRKKKTIEYFIGRGFEGKILMEIVKNFK